MVRLVAEWSVTQSNVRLDGFRSLLRASCVSDRTKQCVCGWLYIYHSFSSLSQSFLSLSAPFSLRHFLFLTPSLQSSSLRLSLIASLLSFSLSIYRRLFSLSLSLFLHTLFSRRLLLSFFSLSLFLYLSLRLSLLTLSTFSISLSLSLFFSLSLSLSLSPFLSLLLSPSLCMRVLNNGYDISSPQIA